MNQVMNNSPELQMKYVAGELEGLRNIIAYLYDGNQGAFNAMYFIKSNYKQWPEIIRWLKRNDMKGKRMVEFFQNESPDGSGFHMGVTKIISMLDGLKFQERGIKIGELL